MGLLDKYYRLGRATGINLHINNDGSYQIAMCEIALAGGQLAFAHKRSLLESFAELQKHADKKVSVSLNLSGKGILIKTFNGKAPDFAAILPNAQAGDFYIQHFQSGNAVFVALIRKSEADKLIAEVEAKGYQVLCLSLGPFAVDRILPQLNFYGSPVIFDGHHISLDDNRHWAQYQYKVGEYAPFEIKADSELLNDGLVLPYASAFQLLFSDGLIQAEAPTVTEKHANALFQQKLRVQGAVLLAITFFMLLLNFIAFLSLEGQNTALAQQLGRSQQQDLDVSGLNEKIQQQKQLLKQLGWDGKFNKARLIDSVARCVPRDLTVTGIEVQPSAVRPGGAPNAQGILANTIRLSAYSKSVLPVNEWVERLKLQAWAKSVRIENYWFDAQSDLARVVIILTY
ncbi:hypothetical protein [Mucilaginibacter pedocola]|uniref:Uncharacterized protein n=1 Tax=Mucilaginibacter pedocola TaxID=1792845 RepID=A0A1S9PBJ7_9SPHI|nr:hypothetical protein [Mucilaginibacter pedocola]OOQ58325.1 hypothetical protein BC343_11870 [Mucilaginibacter pedocola]